MKQIFLLILCLLLCVSYAESSERFDSSRNPFKPQLPKKKEEPAPVIIEEPVKIEPIFETEVKQEIMKAVEIIKPKIEPVNPPSLMISGIIWNSDRPQAIVNGQVVDLGDMVGESQIINIHKNSIDVIYKNQYFTISN